MPGWPCWESLDDRGFHLCDFNMPCCGVVARLDTLEYRPHQGFATWFVSAMNPDVSAVCDADLRRLESAAAIPLRIVWQRY